MAAPGDGKTFTFLEPFFGGSHRDFAEGLIQHSTHRIHLQSLPDRFWKWRMRGAALDFSNKIKSLKDSDGLIVSDMMSLSDFKALYGPQCPPAMIYFHENQLTYPAAHPDDRDIHFAFTNIISALCANRVLFNSHAHFNAFFEALPKILKMMPDCQPMWVADVIKQKSGVCQPGCRFSPDPPAVSKLKEKPPLIIWNHRWEFDKNPASFFDALDAVDRLGINFRLAILGESFDAVPDEFISAKSRFKEKIIQYGFVKSRREYLTWLARGHIVVSTAIQENFGISMVEAIRFGCLPLAPNRLSYPEIIPRGYHEDFLYEDQKDLTGKLAHLVKNYSHFQSKRIALSNEMGVFSWQNRIKAFDRELDNLAQQRR